MKGFRIKNRAKLIKYGLSTLLLFLICGYLFSQPPQRFPQPEFFTDYEFPEVEVPEPRSIGMEYFDLFVLIAVLSLSTWFVFKKRSRKLILWISFFSIIYFGSYRNGCICSIGAIQNISLSIFNDFYSVSLIVIGFFSIPLLLSLFAGRIFCGSACPLGIIQDLVVLKPIKIPDILKVSLGLLPFIYLGLSVLYAATNTHFIICKYDPFIGIFRMGAEFNMIVLGAIFLVGGVFIARPFCRFLCPYGALLKICSTHSKHHLSITPKDCINCNLCKNSCPFEAIDYPTDDFDKKLRKTATYKLISYVVLLPVFFLIGAYGISQSYKVLASVHPDVKLANQIIEDPDIIRTSNDIHIQTFAASNRTTESLIKDAAAVSKRFRIGSWWLGGFIGLVIAISLIRQVIFNKRTIYEANKGNCFSCGRCMEYCPVGKPEHPYFIENPEMKDKA